MFFEIAIKVGVILEAEQGGYLFQVVISPEEQTLCLHNTLLVDDLFGSLSNGCFDHIVKVAGGYGQHVGVPGYLGHRTEVIVYVILELMDQFVVGGVYAHHR